MKVYTRQGDKGETGLLYGGRVSKADPRTEAYGTVDEAVSTLGLARALSRDGRVKEILLAAQRELFTVGAELATDPSKYDLLLKHFRPVTGEMVQRLEVYIDELAAQIDLLSGGRFTLGLGAGCQYGGPHGWAHTNPS